MNERDFAGLLQGVKEMAMHMRGEAVPGAVETRIDYGDGDTPASPKPTR